MSESVNDKILRLLQDELQFNTNDPLVGIDHSAVLEIEDHTINSGFFRRSFVLDGTIKTIIHSARRTEKEQGVFPLCFALGFIEWNYKQSEIRTPLWLSPCAATINRVNNEVTVTEDPENCFINPFITNRLAKEFEITIPPGIASFDQLAEFLESKQLGTIHTGLSFIGNFHHHRFEIIKELDELSSIPPNSALRNLLGDESSKDPSTLHLSSKLLFPSDTDQVKVFEALEHGHTVVQGPPGTGKSQVLSNLLGKLLLDSKSAIVVSEKRVALEVLQKKLEQVGLGHLCFIATSETISKDVLAELKESWIHAENYSAQPSTNLQLSEQYLDQLQLQLDLLNRDTLIGGISYAEYMSLISSSDLENTPFISDLPDLSEWLKTRSAVKSLFDKGIHFYVSEVAPGILQQDNFKQLDRSVRNWLTDLQRLKKIFVLDTHHDLQLAMKKAALCQHYDTTTFRKYESLLTPDSKEQKKFLKLRKKYIQLHIIQSTLETEKTNWRSLPSLTETETLLDLLKNSSIIGKWKFKKQWSKIANIPDTLAEAALHKWKQFLVNSNSISQLEIEFCEIGIDDVKNELEFIHQQIQHYTLESKNEWLQLSTADRKIFAEENQALNSLYGQFKSHFRWGDHTQIELFLAELLEEFTNFLQEHDHIRTLSESILRNLKHYTSYEGMEAAVFKSNHTKFVVQFPQFSKFETGQLLSKSHTIIAEQDREFQLVAQEILLKQNERFRAYHQLLQTPSAKLNAGDKELKAALKKGKSILVKEFGKSRNFPSLRELFASEARIWIQLLKPIWLSNPAQIAKCFPMQDQLFDLAVFDEASQIPLQNALGAIQRSKRILVAGDHQQMGPSSYFKTQSEEVTDLLHQASFYWNTISLKHHYRSENPELIRFSNKHFYTNELIAFPSSKMEREPITFHHSKNGIFEDRKNEIEAIQVAAHIKSIIDSNDHIGIVAFSETQLAEIYSKLSNPCKVKLEERLENDTAFFKALENVQGEECDRLIISLGYGRNPEGEFQMRFGPLNTKNGAKRLNVLLTRAKKKINFFASVNGGDFKISSNEAVDLLRLYLLQIGYDDQGTVKHQFPYSLEPVIKNSTLSFEKIYSSIRSASEMVTLVRVLEGRGWEIEFC